MSALLATVWPFLAGIAAIVAAWLVGRQGGKKAAQADADARDREARRVADDVAQEVDAVPDDDLRSRARRWVRGHG